MNNGKKKKVFIHIGPPKTGTTAIQDYMCDVKNKDFHMPSSFWLDKIHHGIHSVARVFANPSSSEDRELIQKEILESKKEITIISDESLALLHSWGGIVSQTHFKKHVGSTPDKIIDNLVNTFRIFDTKVVFYYRNQLDALESLYFQHLKRYIDLEKHTLEEALDFGSLSGTALRERVAYDFGAIHNFWSSKFGEENVLFGLYDRAHLKCGNIVADFCDMVGIPYAPRPEEGLKDMNSTHQYLERGAVIRKNKELCLELKKYYFENNQKFASLLPEKSKCVFMRGVEIDE